MTMGLLVIGGPLAMHFYKKAKYAPTASARVEGPHVVVTVKFASGLDEIRVGKHRTKDMLGSARLKIPVETWGAGEHSIEVELVEDGDVERVEIPMTIPKSALAPFLELRCGKTGGNDVKVRGKHFKGVGSSECAVHYEGDRAVLLDVRTHADAKLTVDGRVVKVAGGEGPLPIPLLPIVASRLVANEAGKLDAEGAESITLALKTERASGAVESDLTIRMDKGLRHHLQREILEATTMPIPWLDGAGKPDKRTILYVDQPFEANHRGKDVTFGGSMSLVGKPGARAIDAGRIAVAEAGEHSAWVCKGYTGTGNLKVVVLTHAMDVTLFDRDGKELAKRKFPQPKLDCPDYVSGKNGETVRYRQRARWTTVKHWLKTVRR
jgi:hypothetical protein